MRTATRSYVIPFLLVLLLPPVVGTRAEASHTPHDRDCPYGDVDNVSGAPTRSVSVGVVVVELRPVWHPVLHSLNVTHFAVPKRWTFHIFIANSTQDDADNRAWYSGPDGEMATALASWRRDGRTVMLHTYADQWQQAAIAHHTRPSNTFPRMRDFWTNYFEEERVVFIQSDTAFCSRSPYSAESLVVASRFAFVGAVVVGKRGVATVGNGGLSIRDRRAMVECVRSSG